MSTLTLHLNNGQSNLIYTNTSGKEQTITPPQRNGYIFCGWYQTGSGNLKTIRNPTQWESTKQTVWKPNPNPIFNSEENLPTEVADSSYSSPTLTRKSSTEAGYNYIIEITPKNIQGDHLGGFRHNTLLTKIPTQYAKIPLIHIFRAKIPTGYSVKTLSSDAEWLTNQQGTGQWQDYAYKTTGLTTSNHSVVLVNDNNSTSNITWQLGGSQFSVASEETFVFGNENTDLYAQWVPTTLTVNYYSGGATSGTLSSANLTTAQLDGASLLLTQTGKYEENFNSASGTPGLVDYNNSSYLSLNKTGYSVPSGSEWKNKSNGKICDQGGTGNQTVTTIAIAEAFGVKTDLQNGNISIDVEVNWQPYIQLLWTIEVLQPRELKNYT